MRSPLAAAALAALALTACGRARQTETESSAATGQCTRCHGGVDNQTGAPPGALRGDRDTTASGVGAHSAHVQAGSLSGAFACTACHPDPRSGGTHLDGTVELALGGFAHEPSGVDAVPKFEGGRCSVYCHGAFRGGNGANAPAWTEVGQGQAACGSCHGVPPPAPHPSNGDCGRCHAGYTAGGVNLATHVNGRIDLDGLACTSCHGDPGRATNAAAPPLGTRGETATTARAVGAHQAHLAGATLGTAVACSECHEPPTSLAHADGTVDLRFGPVATSGSFAASFDGATCATYCHGATLQAGGTNTAPSWTGGPSQAICGSCHGVPPPAPHPSATLAQCAACHPQTMNGSGALIPASAGGKHLDGSLQANGHADGWMDRSSLAFHAYEADRGLASCTSCHGAELERCGDCHDSGLPQGVTSWRQNCVMCHGGTDNTTGAPPRTIWGRGADAVRVGAHTKHLSGSAIAPAFDCTVCHVVPTEALTPGHVNAGTATVSFGGLATAEAAAPTWIRSSATCASTYCHGGTLDAGGTNTAPSWTGGPGEASCGSCHAVPPPAPHPAVSADLAGCATCHPETVSNAGAIIPPSSGGKHLDGQSQAAGGHGPSWMDRGSPGFHAYSADTGLASCQSCHGTRLDALAGGNCANCHDGSGWPTNCTMCHGDASRAANPAAPPRTIWGRGSDPIRVGAHAAHLTSGPMAAPPFGCNVCHVVPADAFSAGHVDRGTATVTFGGLAIAPGAAATPTWDRTARTCASTYCHGATLGGGTNKTPDWTSTGQAGCGTCHGLPPPAPHPGVAGGLSGCATCHDETVSASGALISPASGGKHLNGAVDGGCTGCHSIPANTNYWHSGTHGTSPQYATTNACQLCHEDAVGFTSPTGEVTGVALSTATNCGPLRDQPCAASHNDGSVTLTPKWSNYCFSCHGE